MGEIHKFFFLLFLAIIEGLTEFLPISSTGHMLLISNILGYTIDDAVKNFIVAVQLGAILSIVVVFWGRLYSMGNTCLMNLFIRKHYTQSHLCILHLLIGTLPAIIFGIVFYQRVRFICELIYVVYGLIAGGMFLLIGELCGPKKKIISDINCITYLQSFLIGCFQCLAFWPGFSRSGATIGAGRLFGLNRSVSLEFSFFLAIPIIFGAAVLTIYKSTIFIVHNDIVYLVIGCSIAFLVALFTVKIFLQFVKNTSLILFVIYRFLLASSIYWTLI